MGREHLLILVFLLAVCRMHMITRTIICLILGAITTVAVAWCFALRDFRSLEPHQYSHVGPAEIKDDTTFPFHQFTPPDAYGVTRTRGKQVARLNHAASTPRELAEGLRRFPNLAGGAWSTANRAHLLAGWPFPAMSAQSCTVQYIAPNDEPVNLFDFPGSFGEELASFDRLDGGIRLGDAMDDDGMRMLTGNLLPCRPVLAGFALNTCVYAFPFLFTLSVLGPMRRGRRMRLGRCPKCAYILESGLEAGCPECGWNRVRPEAERGDE